MKKLWDVEVTHNGIRLHTEGSSFVYARIEERAYEIFGRQYGSVWNGSSGHVNLPATCSVAQARKLRRLVLSDIEKRKECLFSIKDALDGINCAQSELDRVREILEGE